MEEELNDLVEVVDDMKETIIENPIAIDKAMEATIKADKKKEKHDKEEQEQEDRDCGAGQWINEDGNNKDVLLNETVPGKNEERSLTLQVGTAMFGESENL